MSDVIREFTIHEFRGNYPDIPFAPGVNVEELKAIDSDPMYVTLPIVPKIGAVSRSGLLYDEALVGMIEEQINSKRPGAGMGHIKEEDRSTAFPIPDGFWIGARRVGETLWGKAYVPPGKARELFRTLKAVGGQISTSIYGKGNYEPVKSGVRRLKDFDLETLDFAPAGRAALGHAVNPIITAEMDSKEHEMDKATLLAELTADEVPDAIRDAIIAEYRQTNDRQAQVAELQQQAADKDTVIETLQTQLAQIREREFESALDSKVAELVDWNVNGDEAKAKVDAFRRTVRQRIVSELNDKRDNLDAVAESVWAEMQPLAEIIRDALAGPPAVVAARVAQNGVRKLEDTPEARRAARARVGL